MRAILEQWLTDITDSAPPAHCQHFSIHAREQLGLLEQRLGAYLQAQAAKNAAAGKVGMKAPSPTVQPAQAAKMSLPKDGA